jgi:hypothetical protein
VGKPAKKRIFHAGFGQDLHLGPEDPYRHFALATKTETKMAQDLLDRFFRDAEGKTNRQIDVYFTLEDMGLTRDKADEGLEYLTSRGLINMFGPDIAFLTDLGVAAISEEKNIAKMPKVQRDFAAKPPPGSMASPRAASRPAQPAPKAPAEEDREPTPAPRLPRTDRAMLSYADPDGSEHQVELGWFCSIGRAEGNTIHLNDQRASKKHAEIKFENGAFLLNDLGAANGTLVNGSYIDVHPLQHSDRILIGRTTLAYQCPEVVHQPRGPKPGEEAEQERPAPTTAPAGKRIPANQTPPPMPPPATNPLASVSSDVLSSSTPHVSDAERPPRREKPPQREAQNAPPSGTPIRVVKGAPDAKRAAQPAEEDLFDTKPPAKEPPAPIRGKKADPDDLFAQPARGRSRAADAELFEKKSASEEDDLFAETRPGKNRKSQSDELFAESRKKEAPTDLFDGPERPTVFDDAALEVAAERARMIEEPIVPIEPVEPLSEVAPLDPLAPIPQAPSRMEAPDEEDMLAATMMSTARRDVLGELEVLEPIEADGARGGGWTEERTPADPAMFTNPPVARPPSRASEPAPDDVGPTLMMEREQIFPDGVPGKSGDREPSSTATTEDVVRPVEAPASEELHRWGEEPRPAGSHPRFGGSLEPSTGGLRGEELPEAPVSLADVSMPGTHAAPTAKGAGSHFHKLVEYLRSHVERADLPDRDELLQALDLLDRHPYIRVALSMSEPDKGR